MNKTLAAALALGAWSVSAPALAVPLTVYSNDFDNPAVLAGGTTGGLSGVTTTVSHQSLVGMTGNILHNDTLGTATVLSLANLPAHDSVDIGFILAFIDSWDSTDGTVAPDLFNVSIDGTTVLSITATNASGTVNYGGTLLGGPSGMGFSGWSDRVYDMDPESALAFSHSASTLTVSFFAGGSGWQGGGDESWGIDNLSVAVNTLDQPVPEPWTLGLWGVGAAALAAFRRRRA